MSEPTSQDRKQVSARDYIRWLFHPSERVAILTRNRARGETAQRIALVPTAVDQPFQRWLQFKNKEQGSDVYIGMNPLKPESRARTKDDILAIRHLYLDLDHDARQSLAAVENSNLVPPPNAVVHTSPQKLQVVWKVEGIALDEAESLLRVLARKFDGDQAATDSTRVLRLPGFRNHKYEEEFVVSAELRSDRIFGFQDFRLKTDTTEHEVRLNRRQVQRSSSNQHPGLSQSEHDWAYAKRALARGDDPKLVVERIASYRAREKSDPNYYAQLTVSKARADLTRDAKEGDLGRD